MKYLKTFTRTESKEIELKAPQQFGMFTAAGNRRLRGYAETLLRQIDRGRDPEQAVLSYLKKYHKTCNTEAYGEASDTAVRESVRIFAERVLEACGYWDAYAVEERLNEKASRQVREQLK